MKRLILLAFCAALALPAAENDPLRTLKKAHPRLIASASDIARIRSLIRDDPFAAAIHQQLREAASRIESSPTVKYKLVGPRLLAQSRLCLSRVYTLALLYRLDGEQRYLERALKELRAAAAFPDWNPSHFLDTAEMSHAFAIGYDWLYPALKPRDRAWIRKALVDKGLRVGLKEYERGVWWSKAHMNWNQVCNGGLGIGALAVADEEPELSRRVLQHALHSIPLALGAYAPDGGWAEGPGYWHYATRYTVYFLVALESALGTDFGLSEAEGFDHAGRFRIYFCGPAGKTFNYADAHDRIGGAPEMFWLARRFSEPVYAWQQQEWLRTTPRPDPLDLVWYQAAGRSPHGAGWPLDACFRGVDVAFLRSAWDDPNAIFVAVKGGDNKANHSHLDLGTFVLDAGGVRWAMDLGSDNYNLPQYFGKLRWTYYRLRTESHNTVLLDGANQDPKAAAPITEHSFQPDLALVRVNLSGAYPGRLQQWERTVALAERRQVVIQDKIRAVRPVEALWGMVTDARVAVSGVKAQLRKAGWILAAEILSPPGARFATVSTQPPQPQNQNTGTTKVVVRLPGRTRKADIIVTLTPYPENQTRPAVRVQLPL